MDDLLLYSLHVFTSFFAIMNPIANTPVFLGLVEGESKENKQKIAKKGTLTALIIVVSFIIAGKYIFSLFGLTIPAFKLMGGILIFYVGFEMLMSKKSKIQHNNKVIESENVATSPLAIPILAGPGTIVTAMNFVTKDADLVHILIVVAVFSLLIFLTYQAFKFSEKILEFFGGNLIAVLGKLMGLILGIIGMKMITDGIQLSFNI